MAIEKVQITVSTIKELLDNGYTWLKKDDLGYGSIQEKFQAGETHIAAIRKHPLLKDLDTTAKLFVIIDDTQNNQKNETTRSIATTTAIEPKDGGVLGNVFEITESGFKSEQTLSTSSKEGSVENVSARITETTSVDAFANL